MAKTELTREAKLIDNILNSLTLNSLSVEQVRTILKYSKGAGYNASNQIIKKLQGKDILKLSTNKQYVVRIGETANTEKDCLIWYVIYKICETIDTKSQVIEDYESIIPGDAPFDLMFSVYNKQLYQICFCKSPDDAKILLAERKYKEYAKKSQKLADSVISCFVFPSQKYEDAVLDAFEEYGLEMPHIIAFMGEKSNESVKNVTFSDGSTGQEFCPAFYDFDEFSNID